MSKKLLTKKISALSKLVHSAEWIKSTDKPVFSLLCKEIENREELQAQIEEYMADGNTRRYTEFVRLRNISTKLCISLLKELGFTPLARKQIKSLITKKEDDKNDLADMLKGL